MFIQLTVDYVIHITHAIAEAKPEFDINYSLNSHNKIYDAKLSVALSEMGASVIKGSYTTFLGALALIFSQSQAFRIFFYMFTGIITIAVAHGIILTPALMGEMRFVYAGIDDNDDIGDSTKTGGNTARTTMANLTLAQSVGNSNASEFAEREDYASTSPRLSRPSRPSTQSTNARRELTPIMTHKTQLSVEQHIENGVVANFGPKTSIDNDKKRTSRQMAYYSSNESNDSYDPFVE